MPIIFALVTVVAGWIPPVALVPFPCVPSSMTTYHTDNAVYYAPGMPGYSAEIECQAGQPGFPYGGAFYSHASRWVRTR